MGAYSVLSLIVLALLRDITANKEHGPSYDENDKIAFGYDNVLPQHQGRDIQLSLDQSSGSGIQTKQGYGSGFFHMRIKLPGKDSAGVVTAFYMTSHTDKRNELDFEFLGNREEKPHLLQTNVILDGKGDREQRIHLWFDPTASFHTYRILWNQHQIVFFVDNIPIRVFKNNRAIGVDYPTQQMQIEATICDGDSWATDGGQTKIDWTHAPFKAQFRSFGVDGCPSYDFDTEACYSTKFWWNTEQFSRLSPDQERKYQAVKNMYMAYDYRNDRPRHPTPPSECPQ